MAKSDGLERFRAAAAAVDVDVTAVRYPEGTRTAVDAAAAVGCDVAQIVKSLLLMGPAGPVLALTAGHHRVDLDRLSNHVGGTCRMANADEAREATGYAIGGTPPFGHPHPIETLLDPSLLGNEVVYAAAGTPDSCFPIAPETLRSVTSAEIVEFTTQER